MFYEAHLWQRVTFLASVVIFLLWILFPYIFIFITFIHTYKAFSKIVFLRELRETIWKKSTCIFLAFAFDVMGLTFLGPWLFKLLVHMYNCSSRLPGMLSVDTTSCHDPLFSEVLIRWGLKQLHFTFIRNSDEQPGVGIIQSCPPVS